MPTATAGAMVRAMRGVPAAQCASTDAGRITANVPLSAQPTRRAADRPYRDQNSADRVMKNAIQKASNAWVDAAPAPDTPGSPRLANHAHVPHNRAPVTAVSSDRRQLDGVGVTRKLSAFFGVREVNPVTMPFHKIRQRQARTGQP